VKNYYQILGVDRSAGADDIKRAFRRLASQHHPDKGGDTTKFQEIQEAYGVLGNEAKRAEYDNPSPTFGKNTTGGWQQANAHFNFDDIFEMFGARINPNQNRTSSQRISVWISLETAARGGNQVIAVTTRSGNQTLNLTVPQGIQDNENVRYPGLSPGGQDLIVNYRVQPNRYWTRNGLDLYTDRGLDFWQLILGTQLTISDIFESELELTVPPRTRPGAVLRARGRGLRREGHGNGDLLIKINAVLPDDISTEVIDVLKKIQSNK
jgi:curved DNA-binding protein